MKQVFFCLKTSRFYFMAELSIFRIYLFTRRQQSVQLGKLLLHLSDFRGHCDHCVDTALIQLVNRQELQHGKSVLIGPGLLIGSLRRQGVKDVTDRGDSCRQ